MQINCKNLSDFRLVALMTSSSCVWSQVLECSLTLSIHLFYLTFSHVLAVTHISPSLHSIQLWVFHACLHWQPPQSYLPEPLNKDRGSLTPRSLISHAASRSAVQPVSASWLLPSIHPRPLHVAERENLPRCTGYRVRSMYVTYGVRVKS